MLLKIRVVPSPSDDIGTMQDYGGITSGHQTPEPWLRFRQRRIRFSACMLRFVPFLLVFLSACDHGLEPPEEPPTGAIEVDITYLGHPEAWPPRDSVRDLRFVAMRFVPADTSDFLQLNRLVFSSGLEYGVEAQTVTVGGIETGPFLYSGVAQQYGADALNWRPVGLVQENDGVFIVRQDETTHVSVTVDFRNPPPFPPPIEP